MSAGRKQPTNSRSLRKVREYCISAASARSAMPMSTVVILPAISESQMHEHVCEQQAKGMTGNECASRGFCLCECGAIGHRNKWTVATVQVPRAELQSVLDTLSRWLA